MKKSLVIVVLLLSIIEIIVGGSLVIVRGVSPKHQSFYDENEKFTCFDGSMSIPFASVNDDYCDCPDGTDEPGTAACPHGHFYCANVGYKPHYLQSSRVNDGLCDCCDGSDEYDSGVACFNQCKKFGLEELEKRKKELEEANAGFNTKQMLIETGKDTKVQKQKRFAEINAMLEERRTKLEELKRLKEEAETPEKEAKAKHQKGWEELQAKQKEERENLERGEAFALLDVDKDGWVTLAEIMSNNHLDADVSEADAQDFLGGEAMVDSEKFLDIWPIIKPRFLKAGRPEEKADEVEPDNDPERAEKSEVPPTSVPESEPLESSSTSEGEDDHDEAPSEEHDGNDDDNKDEDEDEEEDYDSSESENKGTSDHESTATSPEEGQMPEYDEETKRLIQVADDARRNFDDLDRQVKKLETEQGQLQSYLDTDFGEEEEFSTLKGECFEFTDREYTYKLCPFEKVTQRSKSGGSETDLGRWGKWEGSAEKYTRMKYENGQGCWNGPSRSTLVKLSCGKENVVVMVSEPSRCEYEMEFKTPALCTKAEHVPHIEL